MELEDFKKIISRNVFPLLYIFYINESKMLFCFSVLFMSYKTKHFDDWTGSVFCDGNIIYVFKFCSLIDKIKTKYIYFYLTLRGTQNIPGQNSWQEILSIYAYFILVNSKIGREKKKVRRYIKYSKEIKCVNSISFFFL